MERGLTGSRVSGRLARGTSAASVRAMICPRPSPRCHMDILFTQRNARVNYCYRMYGTLLCSVLPEKEAVEKIATRFRVQC